MYSNLDTLKPHIPHIRKLNKKKQPGSRFFRSCSLNST
ncbi:Uncharacterized protein dnm_036590 [Desulfonema magnum]|uniref:Uncharacterized protein n=1 Tax=Desulfonema magnum TaxID=45655 RepID=A0A975GN57_9BACT|nr:Uncharacterized protein dnm_036590 [Desulfonema magnum]